MKHLSLVAILVSILFIAACSAPKGPIDANTGTVQEFPPVVKEATASSVNEHDIEIQGFAFSQSELTIKNGETVIWANLDPVDHTVTSDTDAVLESPSLKKGQSFSHTFTEAGVYSYHCTFHPNMEAKIIVE
ncbi:MAG TPA: cupredoxin family copper-binding protein [Candidatus Nanoarchaeia archaeon]|nr:cupredoxin family copper-binding protein [Candidatus Nanoarchaeia archaeon]